MKRLQDGECEVYLAEDHLNSICYISEAVMGISPSSLVEGFDVIYREIVDVHGWFITFLDSVMTAIVKAHLRFETAEQEGVSAEAVASNAELKFPCFVDTTTIRKWLEGDAGDAS